MTIMQLDILQFAKRYDFHVTLRDYLGTYPEVDTEEALEALLQLKAQRLVVYGPDPMTSKIGATSAAWKKMGWRE